MANPIINTLPEYVEQNRLPLIAKTVLEGYSREYMSIQTGCKGATALNLLTPGATIQAGGCGFNGTEDHELTQRTINAKLLKVNQAFCDKDLLKTWAQHEVMVAAGREKLPFEQQFVEGVIKSINKGIDEMIWKGDSAAQGDFDGLIKILNNEADAIKVDATSAGSAYEKVMMVYNAMPTEAIADGDGVIFVGQDLYRSFISDLVANNFYHYDPMNGTEKRDEFVYMLPGTNVRVVGVAGLNMINDPMVVGASAYAVGANIKNLYFGCDLEGDNDTVDLWYSKDNQEFRLAVNFIAGVQVAFPDQAVLAKVKGTGSRVAEGE